MHTDKHGCEDMPCANNRELNDFSSGPGRFTNSGACCFYPCSSVCIRGLKLYADEIYRC